MQHIFFSCPKYDADRADLEKLINDRVAPENIVHHMMQSRMVWSRVKAWSAIVLQELRRKEWQRSSDNRRLNERWARKACVKGQLAKLRLAT